MPLLACHYQAFDYPEDHRRIWEPCRFLRGGWNNEVGGIFPRAQDCEPGNRRFLKPGPVPIGIASGDRNAHLGSIDTYRAAPSRTGREDRRTIRKDR